MIGYKVFTSTWTAVCGKGGHNNPYQYKVGDTYEEKESPHARRNGFHCCKDLVCCFNYYRINPTRIEELVRIAELEILGDVDQDGDAFCTNKMRILREVPWREAIKIVEAQMNDGSEL